MLAWQKQLGCGHHLKPSVQKPAGAEGGSAAHVECAGLTLLCLHPSSLWHLLPHNNCHSSSGVQCGGGRTSQPSSGSTSLLAGMELPQVGLGSELGEVWLQLWGAVGKQ